MKPIQLIVTAFGPYKEKEVIDFRQLNGQHLFVISGTTGAGKTTIFDGICFALYGTASGTDRANTGMLRSHFADDEMHTSVDFQFQIRGRNFRVFRQLGHTKMGNKTKTGERNELYEQTENGEIPIVDRQIVTEINTKIETLIGLTEDQFKQIVMLPQGEFRKLLTSETENKEAILRRLFQTERYKEMHVLLKDKIEAKTKEFSKVKHKLDHYIDTIQSSLDHRGNAPIFAVLNQEYRLIGQIIAGLQEEKTYLQEKINLDEKQYKQDQKAYEQQQQLYHQSVALNERFTLFDQKKQEWSQLEQQAAQFIDFKEQLKAAESANHLLPYETNVKDREKEQTTLRSQIERSKTTLQSAEKALLLIKETYDRLEGKAEERANRQSDIKRYQEFLPIVQEINQRKESLMKQKSRLQAIEKNKVQREKQLTTLWEKITTLKQTVKQQETELEPLHEKQLQVNELRSQYKMMREYVELRQQTAEAKENLQKAENVLRESEQAYQLKELAWLDNQALVLAGHLAEGSSCPVCGSTHHPEKAQAEGEAVTKEQLEGFKKEADKRRKHFEELDVAFRTNEARKREKQAQLVENKVEIDVTSARLAEIAQKGKELRQETDYLQKIKEQLQQHKKQLEQLEISYEEETKEKQRQEKSFNEEHSTYAAQQATFRERMSSIPEELQDLKELRDTLQKMEQIAKQAEQEWQLAQTQLKEKEATYTTAVVTLNNEKTQLEAIQTAVQKAQVIFQEKLEIAGFSSVEVYEKARMTEDEQQRMKRELEVYAEKKLTLEKQIFEMTAELKGKERQDIDVLKVSLADRKEKYEQALTVWRHTQSQAEFVNTMIVQIKETEQESAALEKEVAGMTDVYDMIRGQNPKKISFERYLQIDYLDQIIHAANGRFRQLMHGQFYLLRSERQEAYGKQSGLAIDVHDSYTGQTRDVKTLSGGEKFIASLCLALGMSDVIQSEQGSISIETMFIDEGFGSLDEESLHKSIDALIQIQQTGRMIGVISHVEELKTIFPAMLQVEKTKEGHSKTKFILK